MSTNKKEFNLPKILKRQLEELPEEYVTSLLSDEISDSINQFLEDSNIEAAGVRTDIVMLLIGVESYSKFPQVVMDEYEISENEAYKLRDFVNKELYNQVIKLMSSPPSDSPASNMPVPPPPPAPSAGYGGTSDPYREPPE